LAPPVTERVLVAVTARVPLLFRVSDEKVYAPPESVSVALPFTVTLPYAPAASVRDAPEFRVTLVEPAVADGIVGAAGIAGNEATGPYVAPPFPRIWFVSTGPSETPLFR
jgi:hypothetical protein